MDPPALRLKKLEEVDLPPLQGKVDSLRWRGRLHQDSEILGKLVHLHVRRLALARLAFGGLSQVTAQAHLDCAKTYARMGLWDHACSHAKKGIYVHDKVAPGGAADVDPRVLRQIFEGIEPTYSPVAPERIAHAIIRSEFSRDFSPLLKQLEKCEGKIDLNGLISLSNEIIISEQNPSQLSEVKTAKALCLVTLGRAYVHLSTQSDSGTRTVEALRVLKAAMEILQVKDLSEGDDDEDEHLDKLSHNVRSARADLCCAMAEYSTKKAEVADKTLETRSKEAADEWLLGEEGQEALKLLTRELTEKAISSKNGSSASENIVELRRKSEARATTKLINDTSNAIKEQLLAAATTGNIEAGGKRFREAAVEWLVRAWVLRESIHKRDEPELGLMYERLGEAHIACKTLENYEEGASMFRTALDIFNKSSIQTPVKARVAERLGRAEMLCQAYAEAGDALATAGEFYSFEANRGLELEESPEIDSYIYHNKNGKGTDTAKMSEINNELCISHKGNTPLVISTALGVIPCANKAREILRLAGKNYARGGRWNEAGKAYSYSVQIATKYFGATSLNVADDLSVLGRYYARNEMGDIRNARKTLLPAIDIYKLHLGNKHLKVKKNEVLLNRLKGSAGRGRSR